MSEKVYVLGIESSCDDTAAAVLCNNLVLSNVVAGQKIHESYGGVVPELASRAHQQHIVPVVDTALKQAGIDKGDLNAIAFTQGPGLLGSLLVGASFAKGLANGLGIPALGIHHMQGHILAHFIADANEQSPTFPFLALTISGGHTQIVRVDDYFDMTILGETMDDAIGEAFDKSGKLLQLGYPAGPEMDRRARLGNPKAFAFTKPTVDGLNFSFSGLKTAILYFIQKETKANPDFIHQNINDICASIQHTIVEIVMDKLVKASAETGIKKIAIGGGVSANSGIREAVRSGESRFGWTTYIPKFEYTTDNAAMIGICGYLKLQSGLTGSEDQEVSARLKF
ncbi:MAG: tRNA (adenosine(37)-N6)-threonylcarbamoyltransferase complex transferase subunit TsaD [Flavobacteriaceae bacterium]|jgi:N6-L-threonylcarbamoyladenine synthase|nr:tRNA (adenosine(37)-N6)-threonylcarbamoyltransferase complex transferase subunit TsaD [Flavobacteriaceae bacterium]